MKRSILLLSAIFFCSNLLIQGQEISKQLTHRTDSLWATVWNNGLIGENAETGASGFITWNGINGIWTSSITFGTQTRGSANGGTYAGAGFWDMVNVSSNFAAGFTEETVGTVTFDQVSMAVISDDNATVPYGFDVIQKTYSLTGENLVFCRSGYVNTTNTNVTDLYVGYGGDWEVGNSQSNRGGVDTDVNLVYTYEPGSNKPYFGFAVIDSLAGCKVYNKLFSSESQARQAAFTNISTLDLTDPGVGNQKCAVGSFIKEIAVGDTAWVTFAILAGNNLAGIKANAVRAFEIAKDAGWTDKNLVAYSGDKIINVPDDYSSIQAAINASVDGDTVLVADGTYNENINFNGKAITVASHFLKDYNTNHIDNTTIKANGGTAVQFSSGEDTTSVLYGFTVTGGTGGSDPYGFGTVGGGGIIINSGAKIDYNKITGNIVTNNSDVYGGGIIISKPTNHVLILNNNITNNKLITPIYNGGGAGIFCYDSPNDLILIAGNTISDNKVLKSAGGYTGDGGGIYLKESKALIRNNLIKNNGATYGGGISVDEYPNSLSPDFLNNTIVNNEAASNGGGLYVNSAGTTPKMLNSILWGNTAPTDPQLNSWVLTEYSDIEGGFTGIGNIDQDPLFKDTIDYYLFSESPCINTGCPEPIYNDIDETINDMGCYGGHSPLDKVTDVEEITDAKGISNKYILSQNYPNPFNPSTVIRYSLPSSVKSEKSNVKLIVFDILGREVATLVNQKQNPGHYQVTWDASNQPSGVYFYQLTNDNFVETKKMLMIK